VTHNAPDEHHGIDEEPGHDEETGDEERLPKELELLPRRVVLHRSIDGQSREERADDVRQVDPIREHAGDTWVTNPDTEKPVTKVGRQIAKTINDSMSDSSVARPPR
jgi:hypothetical protein